MEIGGIGLYLIRKIACGSLNLGWTFLLELGVKIEDEMSAEVWIRQPKLINSWIIFKTEKKFKIVLFGFILIEFKRVFFSSKNPISWFSKPSQISRNIFPIPNQSQISTFTRKERAAIQKLKITFKMKTRTDFPDSESEFCGDGIGTCRLRSKLRVHSMVRSRYLLP